MSKITNLLGDQAAFYLEHTCRTIDKSLIHIPSPNTIDDTWISSDRNIRTLSSLQALLGHGRLDRKSTRLNSSHDRQSRMPSSA